MKQILCVITILCLSDGVGFAQQNSIAKSIAVPSTVKAAFIKKYPQTSKVSWKRRDDDYEARWGKEHSVTFTPSGKFIQETDPIPVNQLPEDVVRYVKMTYKADITAAGKVTDLQGKTSYVAQVEGRDLMFDKNGRFMKAEKK